MSINSFSERLAQALDRHALTSIADVKGNIIYANEKFCEVSGYSYSELMGSNHRILKSDAHNEVFFKNLWKTIASGQTWHGEICNKAKNGLSYWVETTIVPFLNKDTQKPEQYVSIRTEITRQKEIQKKLDHLYVMAMVADEAKKNFLSNTSHELRTPLNHIIGFSEILEQEVQDQNHLEYIGNIKQAGYKLLDKVWSMLQLADRDNLRKKDGEPIDIIKLVNAEFIEYFKRLAITSKRKFTKNIPDREILVSANGLDLLTAFRKIAENSVHFSSDGDSVGVNILVDDEIVTIEIYDTGTGLPPHILSGNLEPFIIGEAAHTKRNSGIGLGLPISKKLCLQNGGEFDYKSDQDNGTKIYFKFPIVQS